MKAALPSWVDIADLRAQQAMADVAQQVLYLTWGQIALGVVGTLALFFTLRETRRATSTALMAVRVQQTAERGVMVVERPTLYTTDKAPRARPWEGNRFEEGSEMELSGAVKIINRGKSIALIRGSKMRLLVSSELPPRPIFPAISQTSMHKPIDVLGEMLLRAEVRQLTIDETVQMAAGDIKAWIFGSVTYDDLFGETYELRFCYRHEISEHDLFEDGGDPYWRDPKVARIGVKS